MTAASLKEKRVRDLARMAKQSGVRGWHSMRKDQLINALVRRATSAQSLHGSDIQAEAPKHKEACNNSSTDEKKPANLQRKQRVSKTQKPGAVKKKTARTNSNQECLTVERAAVIKRIKDTQAQQARAKSLVTNPEHVIRKPI